MTAELRYKLRQDISQERKEKYKTIINYSPEFFMHCHLVELLLIIITLQREHAQWIPMF